MKRLILKTGMIAILAILTAPNLLVIKVSAQTQPASNQYEYTVLAPLPGTTKGTCDSSDPTNKNCQTDIKTYVEGFFKLAIGLSAVAAVLMIVWGGFQYITTDALQGKSAGKERIKNAIYGLILVIGAWLILNEINPNLMNINLNIESVTTTAPAGGTLEASSLQPAMEDAYIGLAAECIGCTIRVTSTTGDSHDVNSLHYQGLAIDIAPDAKLTEYLTGSSANPSACRIVSKTVSNQSARFLWEPKGSTCGGTVASSGDHWHMSVTP